MTMNNTIAWIIVAVYCIVSAIALTATTVWVLREQDPKKAWYKIILFALLFTAVILVGGIVVSFI